jgi:hypothetical protein
MSALNSPAYSDTATSVGTQGLIVRVEYLNVGKEPALGIQFSKPIVRFLDYQIDTGLTASIDLPDRLPCLNIQAVSGAPPMYPSPSVGLTKSYVIETTPNVAHNLTELLAGRRAMIFAGCVAYRTFKEDHRIAFCFLARLLPDKTVKYGYCDKWSYAD